MKNNDNSVLGFETLYRRIELNKIIDRYGDTPAAWAVRPARADIRDGPSP